MKPVWLPQPHGALVPRQVVKAADNVLVGRARHDGEFLLATVMPELSCAYVYKNGREYVECEYEVLVGAELSWQTCEFDYFPPTAAAFKTKNKGEKMFIGRVNYKDTIHVGRVVPSRGLINFCHNGEEVCLRCYDVLVLDRSANWISARSHFTPSDAVVGGSGYKESIMYIGRALHDGKWVLAKVIPNLSTAFISPEYEYNRVCVRDYQLLCGNSYRWHKVYDHFMPPNAVSIGTSPTGLPRYLGRIVGYANHLEAISVDSKNFVCQSKWNEYEILVNEF